MQTNSMISQTAFEIGAVLDKLSPSQRSIALGTAVATVLNHGVPAHEHHMHLSLMVNCAMVAMNGSTPEQKTASSLVLNEFAAAASPVEAVAAEPAEPAAAENASPPTPVRAKVSRARKPRKAPSR